MLRPTPAANRTIWTIAVWMPIALLVLAVAAVVLMRTRAIRRPRRAARHSREKVGRHRRSLRFRGGRRCRGRACCDGGWRSPSALCLSSSLFIRQSSWWRASAGGGPGILATVLSALAADYWFIPPYGSFRIEAPNDVLALGIFTGTGLFLSVLAERLRRARWAEAISVAQEQQLEELSRLNEELSQQSEELSQQSEELAQQNEELQTQSEEIQTLNTELTHREDVLQKLLDAARLASSRAGGDAGHLRGGQGDVRPGRLGRDRVGAARRPAGGPRAGRAGAGGGEASNRCPRRIASPSWSSRRTRRPRLADASLRPDIALVHPPGEQPFQAVLAAPMRTRGTALRRRGRLQPPEAGVDGRAVPPGRVAGRPVCRTSWKPCGCKSNSAGSTRSSRRSSTPCPR